MTVDDLKNFFTANYPKTVRIVMSCMPKEWGYDRREEVAAETMGLIWRVYQRRYVLGFVNTETAFWELKQAMHYTIRQGVLGRKMPQSAEYGPRGQNQDDAYDKMHRITINASVDAIIVATPVDEAVAFKLDLRAVLVTLTERDRDIIACMIAGFTGVELAERFGISAARISQLRSKYKAIFDAFFGE